MYSGRKTKLQLGQDSVTLARPSYAQMTACAELVDNGEIIAPLLEAAADKPALEKLLEAADHEDVGKLFDDFCEFAGTTAFLSNTLLRIKTRNDAIMAAVQVESETENTTNTSSSSSPPTESKKKK